MPTPQTDFRPSLAFCSPVKFIHAENGIVAPEPLSVLWYRSMKALRMPYGYNVGEIQIDGQEVGDARNMAVQAARERNHKYLMFIDTDTALPADGVQWLVYQLDNHPEYDIAAGFYVAKTLPTVPLIWKEWGKGVFWDFTLGDTIYDVQACAAGCMLLRMSLFDRLPGGEDDPWFKTLEGNDRPHSPPNYKMTEDIYFCRRAVSEANARILVDTRVYCKHIDWRNGLVYMLDDDSLPVRRLAERKAKDEEQLQSA